MPSSETLNLSPIGSNRSVSRFGTAPDWYVDFAISAFQVPANTSFWASVTCGTTNSSRPAARAAFFIVPPRLLSPPRRDSRSSGYDPRAMKKRDFLRTSAGAALGILLGEPLWARFADLPPSQLAREDDFWTAVRAKYRLKPDYLNLESGYYTIQATPVLEAFIAKVREINYEGSYYLRTTQVPDKAAARDKVAALAGCAPNELCITRNTTESIDTVINGYEWKAGDETVLAESDYPHMIAQFKLIARRRGTVNKIVTLPLDPKSDEEIVRLYADAITPRTRLLMVSHMVNVTGQILPVRKIADMAHARGVDVLVDGAHAFAHIDFRIPDLGGD